jgi:SAM-dependent methyltransferase
MDKERIKIFKDDYAQAAGFLKRSVIKIKEIYYFFQRPIINFFLKRYLRKFEIPGFFFDKIDYFLKDDGGMFKDCVYSECDKFRTLENSVVLVPGAGYGRNIFQLAARRPGKMVAFDIYEYTEEWSFLKKEVKDKFGVDLEFYKGDFDSLPEELVGSFDFIVTDAVLEHVKNLKKFVDGAKKFLKNEGVFYASFGPLWYGPCGDHLNWEESEIFNHILFSPEEYNEKVAEISLGKQIADDSCDALFMAKEKLFSYLEAKNYFDYFLNSGFEKGRVFAKIATRSIRLFKRDKSVFKRLDEINSPVFDRFCSGMYFWFKLKK